MTADPATPEPPPRAPWTRQLADALWRARPILAFEAALGAFELGFFFAGWLNALALVAIPPLGFLLYAGAVALLRRAAGRRWSFRFGMRHLMLAVVLAAVVLVMARELGWSLLLLPVLVLPPIVGLAVAVALSGRDRSQQDGLLAVLAMAAHRGMPLGPAVSAFGGLCRGMYRGRVERLAARLDAGASLPEALDAAPGALPGSAAAVARVGWDSGTLDLALDAARAARRRGPTPIRAVFGYPLVVVFALCCAAAFLLLYAVPRLRAIVQDYGLQMHVPRATALDLLAPASAWATTWASPDGVAGALAAVPALGLLLFVAVVAVAFAAWWHARRLAQAAGALSGSRALAAWLEPPDFRRDSATILRALAVAFEGGRTVPRALAAIEGRDLGRRARRRLRSAALAIEGGEPWLDALRDHALVRPADAAVLETAARAGNLAWALRERADAADRREDHRLRAWGLLLRPVTIVGLGLLVLAFAACYFQPLAAMIRGLAEETIP
jgi:protein transport protein HofC